MLNVELFCYILLGVLFTAAVIAGTIGDYILDNAEEIINKQEKENHE